MTSTQKTNIIRVYRESYDWSIGTNTKEQEAVLHLQFKAKSRIMDKSLIQP